MMKKNNPLLILNVLFIYMLLLIYKKDETHSDSIACMDNIAASVLLKLSINSYERCHTIDVP